MSSITLRQAGSALAVTLIASSVAYGLGRFYLIRTAKNNDAPSDRALNTLAFLVGLAAGIFFACRLNPAPHNIHVNGLHMTEEKLQRAIQALKKTMAIRV